MIIEWGRPTFNAKAPTCRKSPTLKPKLMLRHAFGRLAMRCKRKILYPPIVAKLTLAPLSLICPTYSMILAYGGSPGALFPELLGHFQQGLAGHVVPVK